MAFVEDLTPFFDTATGFAVSATWNGTATVAGILDRDYAEPLGNVVEARAPIFVCAEAAVSGIKHGDALVVLSTTYKVRGVEPDGTGIVTLRLEQQ
jgi:hypothetical protein